MHEPGQLFDYPAAPNAPRLTFWSECSPNAPGARPPDKELEQQREQPTPSFDAFSTNFVERPR